MTTPENVTCACCGKAEAAITGRVPFAEPTRSELLSRVGAACWQSWLEAQLKIINEYRLNLAESSSRELLDQACRQFCKLDEEDGESLLTGPDKARELGNL